MHAGCVFTDKQGWEMEWEWEWKLEQETRTGKKAAQVEMTQNSNRKLGLRTKEQVEPERTGQK